MAPALINLLDYERAASERLPPHTFGYYSSGSDDEITLRRNRSDFDRFVLRPRMLQGVERIDLGVTLFGCEHAWPVFISPTAMQMLAHPEGELAMARAAAKTNTTMILSTASTYPMADIRAACPAPMWFQLYCNKDPGITAALVEAAEALNFAAIVVTVDLPVLGNREIDQRNGFRMPSELQLVNLRAVHDKRQLPVTSDTELIVAQFKPDLSFHDLEHLCGLTKLPVLVKGILRGDDAQLCLDHGAQGIFVSNHGGRQLDGGPLTISVLPEIVDAVAGRCPVLLDSGIRRGTDVLKALALGATAVSIGRPPLWGLAVDGSADAVRVLTILREELTRAMHLCGMGSVKNLPRDLVVALIGYFRAGSLSDGWTQNPVAHASGSDFIELNCYDRAPMLPLPPPPDVASTLPQTEDERQRARELSRDEDQPPAEVPGFRVQRKIGEGRFGSVWLAREQNTGKQVAIKFYAQRRGVDWSLLGREVEKLAVLYTSRNIVGLLHVGWDHDPPYYVMEYLSRGSLADRLAAGPLSVLEAVRIATRLSQALVHAHGSGILHCDLKPANVLLDQDGEPRLCDFGQSRLADERSGALGTLFYMAPEQADLKAIPDARWDVYGLGALLYHMVTGAPPFRTPEADAKLHASGNLEEQLAAYRQIVTQGPRPTLHRRAPGIDGPLIDIIDRCLAASPSRRLSNAQAVLDRLTDRERQRSRRPLLLLGLVMPLLLGLFIAPLASQAIYDAVSTAQTNLAKRALESDVLSVNLLSNSLQRELVDRREALLEIAEDDEFRAAVAKHASLPREQRTELSQLLDAEFDRIQQRRHELNRSPDASWFLMDAGGYQRWHRDEDAVKDPETVSITVDQFYGFRDYFHGLKETFTVENAPPNLTPITQPYVSRVYLSTSKQRFRVAISVPVREVDGDKVIGVLARSIYVSDLLTDYELSVASQQNSGVGRVLALIDSRDWKLIAHSEWQRLAKIMPLTSHDFDRLRVSPETIARLQTLIDLPDGAAPTIEQDRVADYSDPMQEIDPENFRGRWLAAFSPIGQTGWIAVVQERRAAAFEAVDELRTRMLLFGVTAVVIVVVLVAGCWWLIVRIVNNRPLRLWRLRPLSIGLPTAGTLTGTARGNDRG